MSQHILERQTIVIHRSINGIQSWSEPLNLNFKPDEVVVREVASHGTGTVATYAIVVPWIDSRDGILVIATNDPDVPYISNPMTHYRLKESGNMMNGDTTFNIKHVSDVIGANVTSAIVVVTLEFLRHDPHRSFDDVVVTSMERMTQMMVKGGCVYPFCLPDSQRQAGGESSFMVDPSEVPIPKVNRTLEPAEESIVPVVTPAVITPATPVTK